MWEITRSDRTINEITITKYTKLNSYNDKQTTTYRYTNNEMGDRKACVYFT